MKLRSIVFGLLLTLASPLAAWGQCSGQSPAATYCGNPAASQALPGWKPITTATGLPIFYPTGAVCDGATDDRAAFQAAINRADANTPIGGIIPVPGVNCKLSAPLTTLGYANFQGNGRYKSGFYRTFTSSSQPNPDTIICGTSSVECIRSFSVDGISFQHSSFYTPGLTTLPDFAGGTGAAHLRIWGGSNTHITKNYFNRLPYGIVFAGGSLMVVEHNLVQGVWDDQNAGVQEGIASVFFDATTAWGNPVSLRWLDNDLFGYSSASRLGTYTIGATTFNETRAWYIGPKYGILVNGLEDASIKGGLIGGQNVNAIAYLGGAGGSTLGPRIIGVQFDGTNGSTTGSCDVMFNTGQINNYTINATITGNTFNGEYTSLHGLCVQDTVGVSAVDMNVSGNTFSAYIGTPIVLSGLRGGLINSNTITAYNALNGDATGVNNLVSAGAYVYSSSAYVGLTANTVGGQGNAYGQSPNYSYNGIVATGTGVYQNATVDAGVVNGLSQQVLSSTAKAHVANATDATSATAAAFTTIGGIGATKTIWSGSGVHALPATGFFLGSGVFANTSTNYNVFYTPDAIPLSVLYLGNSTDPTNYIYNTTTSFGPRTGGAHFGGFSAAGLKVGSNGNSVVGSIQQFGTTTGSITQTVPAAAGATTIAWAAASGTPAVTASSPLALSTSTGNITCATCVTSSGGGAITGTSPIVVSAGGVVSFAPSGTSLGVLYNNSGALGNTAAGTNGQLFLGVTSSAPDWATMSGGASITNAGVVTVLTNANLTGAVTSTGNATLLGSFTSANLLSALTDETGTGVAVFGTSPTLATPVINGLPTGTGISNANTASTLVARDVSGNFAAATITAVAGVFTANSGNPVSITGNAPDALAISGTNTNYQGFTIVNASGGGDWLFASSGTAGIGAAGEFVVYDAGFGASFGIAKTTANARFLSTTDATSSTAAGLKTASGFAAAKAIWGGTTINVVGVANAATTSSLCYNTGTGLFTYNSTVGTCTVSDERLKNFSGSITGALDKLLQIKGQYFTWKDPKEFGKGGQIGVSAQAVEKVFPELVKMDSLGRKSADYQRLVAPIIEALREMKGVNDNLRAEVVALKKKVGLP